MVRNRMPIRIPGSACGLSSARLTIPIGSTASGEVATHERRALDQGIELAEGDLSGEVFHSAVGRRNDALGGREFQRGANAIRNHVGRLDALVGEVEHAEHDLLRRKVLQYAKVELRRVEFVGPQVGSELATDGAMALLFVVIGIMIYLAVRFEWKFAVAAIVANLHDVIIILGFFAFFQWEFSLSVLAAVLAVLGYSVNESVVIFDRVREKFRERAARAMTAPQVLDHAITSTISRTIITHGSTQMMVGSMLLFGGPTLHYFALALTIGILFGIYSSVFVAAAIAMWLGVKREDLVKPVKKKDDEQPELP